MRALVTGGTGFVGRHLVQALRDAGWEVCCVVRRPIAPRDPAIAQVAGDLMQPEEWRLAPATIGKIDAIFHCAAMLPTGKAGDGPDLVAANGFATVKLLETCAEFGIERFIYLSSISVIGAPETTPTDERHPPRPASPYALGKAIGELACETARRQGIKATALRLTSPYGPGMAQNTVLPLFLQSAAERKPLTWHGSGSRAQDFIHVSDVSAACLLAAQQDKPGLYCLGSGRATTMRDLAKIVTTLVPGSHAQASGEADPQEGVSWQVDISALRQAFGFAPRVGLADGIRGLLTPAPRRDWLA